MEDDHPPPPLKGVVVITLPPHDNPSMGKTISAFTLYETPSPPPPPPPPPPPQPQQPQSTHQQSQQLPTQNPHRHVSFKGFLYWSPRIVFGFLGISVFGLMLWNMLLSSKFLELRDSGDDRKPDSFIFPLYPKVGVPQRPQRDLEELKLGRIVHRDSIDFVRSMGDAKNQLGKSVTSPSSIGSSTIFTASGNVYPDGLYFTSVLMGSPPKPYFVDIDTGSDLTWLQCDAPCTSCSKGPHPLYKPTKSNIVPPMDSMCKEVQSDQKTRISDCETCQQCDYEITYADHSSTMGVLSKDELRLQMMNGSVTKFNVVFGCAYDQQGLLLKSLVKTDGILGLSRSKVSFPFQLASQGLIKNVIGHCLTSDASGGGFMFLGDDFIPHWGMAWIPMLNSPSINFYHSAIVGLKYGNKQLSSGAVEGQVGQLVFDTGSSYTYFTKAAYSELVAFMKGVSEELIQDTSDPTLPICWRAKSPIRSVVEVQQFFKTLTFHFASKWWISTKLQISPEGYLIISDKGNVCLGILDGSNVHDGSSIIIGDISLRGKLVVYDNENHRIGWARSDCLKPQKLKTSPLL